MANKDGQVCKQIEVVATYHHDSKNFHAFVVDESQAVKGSIYVLKDSAVPDVVVVSLKTKGEIEAEKKGQG